MAGKFGPRVNMLGAKYGMLTVVANEPSRLFASGQRQSQWRCTCECGKSVVVTLSNLKRGKHMSCGCARGANITKAKIRHGMCGTKVYVAYKNMLTRCTNTKCKNWNDYGGRGIKVCKRWLDSFDNFYADMGDPPTPQHSIDRKENDGNYCKANCRWALKKTQARNCRKNKFLTHNGERRTISEWAELHGMTTINLWLRLFRYKWTMDDALNTPIRPMRR